jgi:hypothetical protein
LISKLKRDGIESVLDLAVSIPYELANGGDYEGNGIEADTEIITMVINLLFYITHISNNYEYWWASKLRLI